LLAEDCYWWIWGSISIARATQWKVEVTRSIRVKEFTVSATLTVSPLSFSKLATSDAIALNCSGGNLVVALADMLSNFLFV
jgi:hypothetical protein